MTSAASKLNKYCTIHVIASTILDLENVLACLLPDNVSLVAKLSEAYVVANDWCSVLSKIGCKLQPFESYMYVLTCIANMYINPQDASAILLQCMVSIRCFCVVQTQYKPTPSRFQPKNRHGFLLKCRCRSPSGCAEEGPDQLDFQ